MCPRYQRHFVPNSVVFLTIVTAGRMPLFQAKDSVETALSVLRGVKEIHPFKMRGYVILPDHWHLLILTEDGRFDRVVHSFKRNAALALKQAWTSGEAVWQNRYYDHVIRDDHDLARHLDYIHYNPVHHGCAAAPADYAFSSFGHYAARGWYPVDWGSSMPRSIDGMNLE
jgi:putative transposase